MSVVEQAGAQAVPLLLEKLKSNNDRVREIAVSLLCAIQEAEGLRHPDTIAALTHLIKTEVNPATQLDAVGLLTDIYGEIKDEAVFSILLEMLNCEHEHIRENVMDALAELGDARVVQPLIELLGSNELSVKVAALRALGRLKDSRATPHIIPILKTGLNIHTENGFWMPEDLAHVAANALTAIGTPEPLEAVKKWESEGKKGNSKCRKLRFQNLR